MLTHTTGLVPPDATRVGLEEEWEVSYWCTRYGLSDQELRSCVAEVGPRTEDVEAYLRRTGRGKQIFSNTGED
jgi:hypothetical protein